MKLFGKVVLLGAGAALGYYLANNKVNVQESVEPVIEKVKTKINEVISHAEDSEPESCIDDAAEAVKDAVDDVAESVEDKIDDFAG